ncbi:hypothetical protein [Ruminococcus sp. FC2018]|uniref:hypothetical protein n=1 Tax=Ruminococcus sp. FC2018 TaxID=1410617 RepID=UPI00048F7CBF|nr:hypothetical protein [Ruminococcus sp. FC2018]
MANFICDICGGNIKMQGSQGGVCQNCGMEYDIEAIRAKVNAPQPKVEAPVTAQSAPHKARQDEIERQALLIHLNDLRTMETMLFESKKEREKLDNKDAEMRKNVGQVQADYNKIKKKADDINNQSENSFLLSEKVKKYRNGAIVMIALGVISIALITYACISSSNMELNPAGYLPTTPFFLLGISDIVKYKNEKKEGKNRYIKKREDLNSSEASALATKEKYESEYNKWKEETSAITTEILSEEQYTREILKNAYNANIIPLQFRTIEGVYYLYDYLSTSNQSLAEALMQANLESIKQRLEQVIAVQGKMVIEQQQANAKLANIQQTNQQILENAKRTVINTAQAAKYAQIAATNTELLTKLNKKQLAYQRADFWLK